MYHYWLVKIHHFQCTIIGQWEVSIQSTKVYSLNQWEVLTLRKWNKTTSSLCFFSTNGKTSLGSNSQLQISFIYQDQRLKHLHIDFCHMNKCATFSIYQSFSLRLCHSSLQAQPWINDNSKGSKMKIHLPIKRFVWRSI